MKKGRTVEEEAYLREIRHLAMLNHIAEEKRNLELMEKEIQKIRRGYGGNFSRVAPQPEPEPEINSLRVEPPRDFEWSDQYFYNENRQERPEHLYPPYMYDDNHYKHYGTKVQQVAYQKRQQISARTKAKVDKLQENQR